MGYLPWHRPLVGLSPGVGTEAFRNSAQLTHPIWMEGMIMKTLSAISISVALCAAQTAYAGGVGNPRPGSPHDALNFHLKKASSGVVGCSGGGHSAFVRYDDITEMPLPTNIFISMVDWVQLDNDNDGVFDEDGPDGVDNDLDGLTDEDGDEPGKSTGFTDCDGLDGDVTLQMRDTQSAKGQISTQEWFIRASGKPEENFAFYTKADQYTCTLLEDPDGEPETGDEVVECSYGDVGDWINLGYVNLSSYDGDCVKQVKLGGKNSGKGGGKTNFCDLTGEFEVDVDINGDDVIDSTLGEADQFIFSVSCVDVPETIEDESETCPLARMIWEIDGNNTTTKAKAQVFVSHTGVTSIKGGKIKGPGTK
jgi:hypothetical protein